MKFTQNWNISFSQDEGKPDGGFVIDTEIGLVVAKPSPCVEESINHGLLMVKAPQMYMKLQSLAAVFRITGIDKTAEDIEEFLAEVRGEVSKHANKDDV